jgi:hypothetical protein
LADKKLIAAGVVQSETESRMLQSTDEYIHHRNVKNYKRQLCSAPGGASSKMLMILLAEEAVIAKANGWFPWRS